MRSSPPAAQEPSAVGIVQGDRERGPDGVDAARGALVEALQNRCRGSAVQRAWVVLLEVVLLGPSLDTGAPTPAVAEALRLQEVAERALARAQDLGAVPVGVADLDLLLAWPPGADGLGAAFDRAFRCCHDLTALFDQGSSAPGPEARFGLVGGPVALGSFGGLAGAWLPVVSGPVIARLRGLLAASRAGELAVCAEAVAAWPNRPAGRMGAQGQLVVALSRGQDPAPDVARAPGRRPRLERVTGTLAVAEILGIDPGRDDQPRRLQIATRTLQRIALRHRGLVRELRHDHRGLCAWVGFQRGEAGKRAALDAIRFADELGRELAGQGIEVPVGIASGPLLHWAPAAGRGWGLAGPIGRRASAAGRASASGVICDISTAKLVRSDVEVEELNTHTGAGGEDGRRFRVEKVPVADALAREDAGSLVARTEELARLELVLEEFRAGGAAALLIEGEPGVGKTRVLGEARARLAGFPCALATVGGAADLTAEPLAPWRDALCQVLGLPGTPAASEVDQALGVAGPPGADSCATLRCLLLRQPCGPAGPHSPDAVVVGLARELAALLGERPVAVLIDDAQWLDSASWGLARELIDRLERLLLVAAVSLDEARCGPAIQRLEALPEVTLLTLRPLPSRFLPQLVERELGITQIPARLRTWLAGASRGNPMLCLEWVQFLREEGALEVVSGRVGRWDETAVGADIPTGLEALLSRRVARLPMQARRTLAVVAAIGSPFGVPLLVAAHPDQPGALRLEAELMQLAQAGLVHRASGGADSAWRMTRGVPAEALAGACDPAELREVHARTAAWLLGRVDNLAPLHGTLAHHWRAAGDHENALRFLELAGNEAQRIGAMVEAGQWFQQALRLVETTPGLAVDPIRRAYWERSLGDVRYACGELERCRVHFDRALALLGRPLPQGRVALLRFVAGQILRWCLLGPLGGDREAAPAAESARHQEASHASERLAERYYYSADVLSMTAASLTSAILARRAGARGRNARPFASIGVIAGILGLDAYAARLHRHALAIGERAGDGAGLTVVLYTRAAHLAGRGEWDAAQDLACRAVAEAERAAAWQEGGVAQTLLGLVFRYQGRFAEAEGCFLALLERARNQYNAQHEAWALYGLGQIQTQTGRFQEAVRSLNLAFSLLRNLEDYPSRLIAQGLLASVLWRQGRRDRALEAAELAWALATQVRRPFVLSTLDGYSGAAEVFLRVWEGERAGGRNLGPAERRARDAVRLVGQFARTFPFGRPSWWQLRGREAAIAGHMDRAVAAWRRCIEEGVRLRTRLAVAESQAALARSGLLAEDEQRRLLDRSNEAFSAMGCLWHLERNRPAVHGRLAGTQQGQPQ